MSQLIIAVIAAAGIIAGKFVFQKWINHLSIYFTIMGGLCFFYEMKLLPFPDIAPMAWFYLVISALSFTAGILTIYAARQYHNKPDVFAVKRDISFGIYADGGTAIKYSIIFFSLIALFVAFQRWYILIKMFGSIPAVLINASLVYQLNHREAMEFIPILPFFVYVAIFLSGLYTALRGRFSPLVFLPFIGVVLKELTYFGRAELLLTFMEFLFTFILFRYILNNDSEKKYKFSKKNGYIATVLLFVFLLGTASFIRVSRGHYENYSGASQGLNKFKNSFIISPSMYLYVSSDVGVFSRYLESDGENTKIGEHTFNLLHSFLSKIGMRETPVFFQKGYYIPMWTNTGTYLRELHADFGPAGVVIGPYLIGLIITWLWFRFYERRSLSVFAALVYFYLIVGFSFLLMVTKFNQWWFSLTFIVLYLPILEKLAIRNKNLREEARERLR